MKGDYSPALGADKALDRVERFRDDLRDLNERWDNRLVLERCSLAELYFNGRLEVVLHSNWGCGSSNYHWACRIAADIAIPRYDPADLGVQIFDREDADNWNEVVMFGVIVQRGEGPKVLVRSVFRPYLLQKKFFESWEGLLYRRETGIGWEVFPWRGRKFDRFFRIKIGNSGMDDTVRNIIQCGSEIAESVTDDIRQRFWNWLFGPVGQRVISGRIEINDRTSRFVNNLVEGAVEGARHLPQPINIAVGPLNLYP